MKINANMLKNALAMFGVDLNTITQQAAPLIREQLDKTLKDIEIEEGESKGIVIIADDKGEYYVVTTKFLQGANQLTKGQSCTKLNSLIETILNSVFHGQ